MPTTARIRVLDDSPSALQFMAEAQAEAGFHIETASDVREGLELIRSSRFDLVLTDIYMPDQDGPEVVRVRRLGSADARFVVVVKPHFARNPHWSPIP